MEYLRSAKAYVEGPAKGMNLSSLTPVAPSLSMPCTMTTDLIGGTLDGTTCGFPLPDDTDGIWSDPQRHVKIRQIVFKEIHRIRFDGQHFLYPLRLYYNKRTLDSVGTGTYSSR